MLYKDLTVRELCASICVTKTVNELFKKGLEARNSQLAIPALEELIRRGDSDLIAKSLDQAFDNGWLVKGDALVGAIGMLLFGNVEKMDPILFRYSKALLFCDRFMGPSAWVRTQAERYRRFYRCGMVKNAKPWAARQIWADTNNGSPVFATISY